MADNKDTKLVENREEKEEKTYTFTRSQLKWIALTTAAVVASGAYVIQKWDSKDPVPNSITIGNEDYLSSHNLSFDPNSNQEMINRISNVYIDAVSKGVKNITVEQWLDFYTVININDIDPADYSRLANTTKTKESIMRNFDYVTNTLLDDTMTSEPSTVIDVSSLVADKTSAYAIESLQERIAIFNTSDSKSKIASELNKFVDEEFGTESYNLVDASSNLVRFKLLLAMERMTINSGYRVPSANMSKMIFGTLKDCNLASKSTTSTKYNGEKTTVKEMLESKLEKASSLKGTDSQVDAIELLTGIEIEMKIQDKINEKKTNYSPNPDVNKNVIKSTPRTNTTTTTSKNNQSKTETKPAITTPVVTQPTQKEIEKQQEEIQKQIDEENRQEMLKTVGVIEGTKDGYAEGKSDGYKGYSYNDRVKNVNGEEAYRDAYEKSYKEQYALGYEDGKDKRRREENKIIDVDIDPLRKYDKDRDGELDDNVYVPSKYYDDDDKDHDRDNDHHDHDKNDDRYDDNNEEETYEAAPGFYYKDGILYDEETDLPVEIIETSMNTQQKINELKELRTLATNIKSMDVNESVKVKKIGSC